MSPYNRAPSFPSGNQPQKCFPSLNSTHSVLAFLSSSKSRQRKIDLEEGEPLSTPSQAKF